MTTTQTKTVKIALNEAGPNDLADALRKVKLGDVLTRVEEEITITSGTEIDLTADSEGFPNGALMIESIRVVTGTATGHRNPGNSDATPSTSLVAISADGKVITFEAAITVAVIVGIPAPAVALSTNMADL